MIELPYPAKILWPNGRGHYLAKHRAFVKHRTWACLAFHGHKASPGRIQWSVTIYPKPRGPLPDRDNTIAALKAYQDGIAAALGINDSEFDLPTLHFAERCKTGKVVVSL